jgi:hypothetical protein
MNGFHRFPIQAKVFHHFCDGQHQTEKKKILNQSFGDSFAGMDQVQFFNSISTLRMDISSYQGKSGIFIKTTEISHLTSMIGMDRFHFLLTAMADLIIEFICIDGHSHQLFFLIIGLFRTVSLPSLNKNQRMD